MSFKSPNGHWFTRQLFFEQTLSDKSNVRYTLKEQDHEGYPSLYRLYMETGDPTEYTFAVSHLGGWSHWVELCTCNWFKPYLSAWRRELEVKIKSEALNRVKVIADTADTKTAFAVNKYLLDGGWVPSPTKKRGAPTKDEIKQAAHDLAVDTKQVEKDFERLMN